MSGKAIGIGLAVLLFLVVLYFVFSGDDTSNAVAEGEEVPEPEVNDPPCSEFECGEGLETKDGELGTTSQQCCQKPLCPRDICSANNVQFKDPIDNARGDTLDECCQDVLCSLDKCSVGYKLSGNELGRTNDDCCIEKPACFPSDGADGLRYPCPEKTHTEKDESTRGSTQDECCTSNSCSVNGWGSAPDVDNVNNKCEAADLDPKDSLGTILGYTSDVCCQQPLCSDAAGITCPEGKKIDINLSGSDAESCCVPSSCHDNGWAEDRFTPEGAAELGISKCKFFSNQTKSRKEDLTNVIGNSVDECCEEKLCSNNYFYDESCPGDTIGVTSPCFKVENIKTGKPLSVDNMKKNCAKFGKKLAPDGTLLPVSGDETATNSTCCVPLTCGELKEKVDKTPDQEGAVDCGADSIFNPEGLSEIAGGDSSENQCCSASTCAEAYQGTDKCTDPSTYHGPPADGQESSAARTMYAYTKHDITKNVKVENMKYNITKGTTAAGRDCCIPKTCADLGFNNDKCASVAPYNKTYDPSKANEIVEGDGIESCCRGKPCSEVDFDCPWNMTKKSVQPSDGSASEDKCCEFQTCADIKWDDAKCKDREYTRASVRGKARKGADGESLTLDDKSKNDITGDKWKADSAKNYTPAGEDDDFEGDKYCCEQDPDNNFARMCVGNEWYKGSISNLSPGVNITDADGHQITPVPGQNYDSIYGKTNEQCMNSCKADDRCTSFTLGANSNHSAPSTVMVALGEKHPAPHTQEEPSCTLYQKLGSSVNVNNLITSEWGLKRTTLQYFSGKTFPEKYRYSGGEIDVEGDAKLLTGDKNTIGNRKWDSNGPWHGSYRGRPERHRATTIAWGDGGDNAPYNDHTKRKEIYLAGVDREFCPVDFVKKYGTWRENGSTVTAGTWHGESSEPLNMLTGSDGLWTGGQKDEDAVGCSSSTSVSSNLDDCYRNLNCSWSWISPVNNGEENQQNEKGSSGVFKSPINSDTLSARKRRFCHKKNINTNSSTWPRHISIGGASVAPTRMITGDGEKKKLKFGVMPDKNPKGSDKYPRGDGYWKNMVITSIGDSSQAD